MAEKIWDGLPLWETRQKNSLSDVLWLLPLAILIIVLLYYYVLGQPKVG